MHNIVLLTIGQVFLLFLFYRKGNKDTSRFNNLSEATWVGISKWILLLIRANSKLVGVMGASHRKMVCLGWSEFCHLGSRKKTWWHQILGENQPLLLQFTDWYCTSRLQREDRGCHELFPNDFQRVSNHTSSIV